MAIASLGVVWQGGNQTAAASIVLTSASDVSPGAIVAVAIAADNAGASGASAVSSVTDSVGNTYALVKNQNRTAGSVASDGCTAALYVCRVTAKIVNGSTTLTVNFSPNVTAKAVIGNAFSGCEDIAYSTNGVGGTGTTYNSAATATASVANGDVVIGVVASESNTVPTADSDTSNGSWVPATQASGGTGGDATKMSLSLQYKIVTGTATQTLNGACTNSDWAVAWGLFTVPVAKSDSDANASTVDVDSSIQTLTAIGPDDNPATGADAGESVAVAASDADIGGGADDPGAATVAGNVAVVRARAGEQSATASGGRGGGLVTGGPNVGQVTYAGGAGGAGGSGTGNQIGGGGGGAAGAGGVGADGSAATAGTPGIAADADQGGGAAGGASGAGGSGATATDGVTGSSPGGAGGGAGSTAAGITNRGSGATGQVKLTALPSGTVRTHSGGSNSAQTWVGLFSGGDDEVIVECWGGGGAGATAATNTRGGGGGGGGGYARSKYPRALIDETTAYNWAASIEGDSVMGFRMATTPVQAAVTDTEVNLTGASVSVLADAGSNGSTPAAGGGGGAGGLASASTGTTKFDGGSGFSGTQGAGNQDGGGGGSSAGTASNGANAASRTGAIAPSGGGSGGTGAQGSTLTGPSVGSAPGGGGGGGYSTTAGFTVGGAGSVGKVKLTYSPSNTVRTFTNAGLTTDTPPGSDTSVLVECWGGGGAGNLGSTNVGAAGGGGGGAYAASTLAVDATTSFVIFVGRAGANPLATATPLASWVSYALPPDAATESVATTLTDDEPSSGADAGESITAALSDADTGEGYDGRVFDAAHWGTVLEELDFSDVTKITSAGGLVSQVDPSSGSLAASVVSSGSNRPQTGVDTQNGLNVLTFDGVNDFLDVDVVNQAQPITLVAVVKSAYTGTNNRQFLGNTQNGSQPTLYINDAVWRFYAGLEYPSTVAVDTNAHIVLGIFNDAGALSQLWIDGVLVLDQSASGVSAGSSALDHITIGADGGGLNPWSGWIGHAVYYSGSVADPHGLSGALNSKWAVYTGTGAEDIVATGGGSTPISDSDSSTSVLDAGESVAASLLDNDPASGADAGESIADATADADTGSAVDAGEALTAPTTDADTGTAGTESEALAVASTDADAGAVVDTEAVAAGTTDSETGTTADAEASLAVAAADAEVASAVDTEAAAASLSGAETGAADDTEAVAASIADAESGASGDAEAVGVAASDADNGMLVDAEQSLVASVSDADTATGLETQVVTLIVFDFDTGATVELAFVTYPTFSTVQVVFVEANAEWFNERNVVLGREAAAPRNIEQARADDWRE